MEKEFVTYQQALKLKELGFDEPCFSYYDLRNKPNFFGRDNLMDTHCVQVNRPTYSQCFRWFREKYFKMSYIYYDIEYKFCFCIGYNNKTKGFNTYEEAESACLDKLIELIETK